MHKLVIESTATAPNKGGRAVGLLTSEIDELFASIAQLTIAVVASDKVAAMANEASDQLDCVRRAARGAQCTRQPDTRRVPRVKRRGRRSDGTRESSAQQSVHCTVAQRLSVARGE